MAYTVVVVFKKDRFYTSFKKESRTTLRPTTRCSLNMLVAGNLPLQSCGIPSQEKAKSGVLKTVGWHLANLLPATPATKLVPNVFLCFPLDPREVSLLLLMQWSDFTSRRALHYLSLETDGCKEKEGDSLRR